MSVISKWLGAFGRFWWDFLVGDTPELFVAVLAVIGVAFALHRDRTAGVLLVIAAVVVFLAVSTWRGRTRRPEDAVASKEKAEA